jgi:integrase
VRTGRGKLLPRGHAAAEIEVFAPGELVKLLQTAQPDYPESYPFLLTLARTGMRLGEAVGLEWRDVDFGGRVLHVRRSVRKGRVSLPKNNKSRRVDMSPQLAAFCRALQVEGHWREHVWRAVLRRAELRYPKIHTLRHTVASLLLARRESLAYVSEQLGHSRPASTLKVYTHLVPREGHRAVDGLDTLGQGHASPAQATALILRDMESLVYRG